MVVFGERTFQQKEPGYLKKDNVVAAHRAKMNFYEIKSEKQTLART